MVEDVVALRLSSGEMSSVALRFPLDNMLKVSGPLHGYRSNLYLFISAIDNKDERRMGVKLQVLEFGEVLGCACIDLAQSRYWIMSRWRLYIRLKNSCVNASNEPEPLVTH